MVRVKFEVQDTDRGWAEFERLIDEVKQQQYGVEAGVLSGTARGDAQDAHGISNVQKAAFNEFGTSRAPARPFISPVFDMYRQKYGDLFERLLKTALIQRNINFEAIFSEVGRAIKEDIVKYVLEGSEVPPPNAPSTVEKKIDKGSGTSFMRVMVRTLVDTGRMIEAVTYRVVRGRR